MWQGHENDGHLTAAVATDHLGYGDMGGVMTVTQRCLQDVSTLTSA